MPPPWFLGLMTGTANDGNVDLALLRTDGEAVAAFGPWTLSPYPAAVRSLVGRSLEAALRWGFHGAEPPVFAEAEAALTRAQAAAVSAFLRAEGIDPGTVAAIGFHGQTVLHDPARARTRQLGDGALMARLTGIATVWDFRSADMAAGGQGAPLAPAYHAALLRSGAHGPEAAVLNLGGVANISWLGPDGTVIGFDTGPANGPIDDWARRHTGIPMDRDGALARAGRVDEARLRQLLEHPFLGRPAPKSLDRFDFPAAMADGLSPADGAATLTAFSAAAVGRGLDLLPTRPRRLIVCGGGRRNPAFMDALRHRAGAEPVAADALGWRGDAIEAECFAFLAARVRRGLPISFPATTGVPRPLPGGRIALPDSGTAG